MPDQLELVLVVIPLEFSERAERADEYDESP